jgi:hypothetical protein
VLWAGVVGASEPPSPCALRAEGYGGMAILDPDGQSKDQLAANAGGAGSAGCLFAPFHFQGDVFGDYADVDKLSNFHPDYLTNVGGGGHVGIADPAVGALELTGAYNRLSAADRQGDGVWRVGGEGELYFDPLTLGVQAGFLKAKSRILDRDFNTYGTGFYARGLIRFYPAESLKLEGLGGVARLDGDVIPVARALVEYRPQGWPVGLFARWEGAFDNKINQNFAVAGLRLYLFDSPATLRETDRRYFRESCVHFLAGARTC